MKIDDITEEEFAAMSDEEQLETFLDLMREYQASVTPERFDTLVELLKDEHDGRTPTVVAAQFVKH